MEGKIPLGRRWEFQDVDFLYPTNSEKYVQSRFSFDDGVDSRRYLVFSAPGAVGKSAFSQYLANAKSAMVWNLASLKLGSNTFIGSVVKAVGSKQLADFLESIRTGETVLVFDALDEAELHSGWGGVESLLRDVIDHTGDARACSVIFLARRDTAELIGMSLEEILGDNSEVATASIGFFDPPRAVDFIVAQVMRARGEEFVSKSEAVLRTKASEAISMGVGGAAGIAQQGHWASEEEERFFGYAPVLQTLAAVLSQAENPHKVSFEPTPDEHSAIIERIISTLIERESQKFAAALGARDLHDRAAVDGCGIYAPEDQLLWLLSYVIGDSNRAYGVPTELGAADSAAVTDMLRSFLPQHPFIDGRCFAGPAFRDYLIAWGLLRAECRGIAESLVDMYQPLFTQILAGVYALLGQGKAHSDDVEILYESASSGAPKGESGLFLFLSKDRGDLNIEIVGGAEKDRPMWEFTSSAPSEVRFRRRLNNAHVLLPDMRVRLGRPEMEFELTGSEVLAKSLVVDAALLRARSTERRKSRLQADEAEWAPSLRIDAEKRALEVHWPQSKSFPWTDYSADFSLKQGETGAAELLHVVHRILSWFRKDRRDQYGRYADLIRNIVVGQSATANRALDFLFEIGAMYEQGNLFYLNPRVLDDLGIRWSATRGDAPSPAALAAAENFLKQSARK